MSEIICGDSLEVLKNISGVDCCVTSPPYYGLRDYGVVGQLGREDGPEEYITKLCNIFDGVWGALKDEGTLFVNIGDIYDKSGCVGQIPSRFAIEMCNRGWILRNEIIWHKPNAIPSSAKNRFTVDFEKIYFFVKQKKYFFNTQYEDLVEGSDVEYRSKLRVGKVYNQKDPYKKNFPIPKFIGKRIKRTVFSVCTKPFLGAHCATFPETLIEPLIDAGCPLGGIVLDPFFGAGTTGLVAKKQGKNYIGIELNKDYIENAEERLK